MNISNCRSFDLWLLIIVFAGSVNLSAPIFNPHPNEMPYYKEPSLPGSYPYPDGQRPKSEPLLKRALSEETGKTSSRELL